MSLSKPLRILLMLAGTIGAGSAGSAGAATSATFDQCRIYGYAPHTRDYALCRMNVRRYWTTGRCGDWGYALAHREFCHLYPPPFI
jgi:hypothetical protein